MTNTSIPFDARLTDEQSALVASCERMAVNVALKKVGDSDDLNDLISAGYDGLIRAAQTYDPAKAKFTTHARFHVFAKIMRHREHSQARMSKIDRDFPDSFIPSRDAAPGEEPPVDPAEIRGAVEALPPKLREVVEHRVWGTDTLRNTAKTLKCSPQTVITRKAKAFDMLRLSLWKYGMETP